MSVHFPKATPTPIELHHDGRADQGFAVIAWPASDFFDQQTVQDLQVLNAPSAPVCPINSVYTTELPIHPPS